MAVVVEKLDTRIQSIVNTYIKDINNKRRICSGKKYYRYTSIKYGNSLIMFKQKYTLKNHISLWSSTKYLKFDISGQILKTGAVAKGYGIHKYFQLASNIERQMLLKAFDYCTVKLDWCRSKKLLVKTSSLRECLIKMDVLKQITVIDNVFTYEVFLINPNRFYPVLEYFKHLSLLLVPKTFLKPAFKSTTLKSKYTFPNFHSEVNSKVRSPKMERVSLTFRNVAWYFCFPCIPQNTLNINLRVYPMLNIIMLYDLHIVFCF